MESSAPCCCFHAMTGVRVMVFILYVSLQLVKSKEMCPLHLTHPLESSGQLAAPREHSGVKGLAQGLRDAVCGVRTRELKAIMTHSLIELKKNNVINKIHTLYVGSNI
ncbi:hypothetical protein XENORESO_006776 [Xenotaenia resolanae]|uniref:Uncharacterized protein n=1 Tax=Xenotaenia resolanae TaxID=208358 RepID=A0ABV0VPS4_9TELE